MKDNLVSVLGIVGILLIAAGAYFLFSDTVVAPGDVQGVQTGAEVEWTTYNAPGGEFSLEYPRTFIVKDSYVYQALGPGKDISGVSFTVPAVMTAGTNLSNDSYVAVERGPDNCKSSDFLDNVTSEEKVTENGITYTLAKGGGAAAGNRYEEWVYILPDCYAVRYFIHSTVLENYPEGTVEAFDREALLGLFDQTRRSLRFASKG